MGLQVGRGALNLKFVKYFVAVLFLLDGVTYFFLVFVRKAFTDGSGMGSDGSIGHGIFAEITLDVLQIAALGGSMQFPLLLGVEDGAGGVEGVEHTVCDDVVGRLVVFAGAEVDGRERGEVQGVAVEEVWHGGSLCCALGW